MKIHSGDTIGARENCRIKVEGSLSDIMQRLLHRIRSALHLASVCLNSMARI
jgi:hypothetical protein